MSQPGPFGLRVAAVRRCLLAVAVLHDVDLSLEGNAEDGLPDVVLDGHPPIRVPAKRLATLLGVHDPEDDATIAHVAAWLRLRRSVARLPLPLLLDSLRLVGLPTDHVLHPGPGWERARVLGGALASRFGLLPDTVLA